MKSMARTKKPLKSFCTTRDAAQMLGISQRSAQLWVESGVLEAWKTEGGHRRISRESVERLLVTTPGRAADNEDLAIEERPPTILVAEDEPDLLRLYQVALEGWPMRPRVLTATDGIEALTLLGREAPQMLVTDLHMPGLDGFHMLRSLVGLPEMKDLLVVVVTGLDTTEIERRGGVPAGIPILPKPLPFNRLLLLAQDHFSKLGVC
ncbi:MAG: response regulator [Gammaproteobacteria bacterium SHHR-1]